MAAEDLETNVNRLSDLFIDGYFSQRVRAGDRPNYDYPINHLPKTPGTTMEVVTSFVAARKPK